MATSLMRLVIIAQLQTIFNTTFGDTRSSLDVLRHVLPKQAILNTPATELTKRSPIDLHSDHPLRQTPHTLDVPLKKNASRKKKAPFIPAQHQYIIPQHLLVIPARSNVHHSSIHTDVTHLTSGNHRIPVISQTVHQTSTNITHPTNLVSILVPNYQNHLNQQHVILHDLSVIPLHHPGSVHVEQKTNHLVSRSAGSGRSQETNYIPIPYYGGYGNGLHFGGHGAGHGFHVAYNFR